MADQTTFRMRIWFRKTGRLALLSHLELARALERTIRRARLPYAISQGFSPHMKIAFGAALPVGVGGLRECFDLQLTRYVKPTEVIKALQNASAVELMIMTGDYIGKQEEAASVAYPLSTYEVVLSRELSNPSLPETITVIRKKKEKELVVSEFLQGDILWNDATATFCLLSKPSGSLRPDKLVAALLESYDDVRVVSLTRIDQKSVM